jgi:serine/threonine protein kinase
LLGKGGMGEVFLALDLTLSRKVALKILPAKFMSDPQLVRRFEREAKAVSALNHPNILTIYEIGKTEDLQFIATEFVAGETLRQGLKHEPMTLQAALEVALQIAAALLAAHESGIIHRDIKPENIMLRRDGQVKVLDFGLAKFTEKAVNVGDSATQTGIIMGTPGYMSPEQARALKMDGRTDIFSLGIVLYEMIAGRQPFEGATSIDVISAILHQDPAPLIKHNAETPPALQRIVSKALQKDQAARYQSVKELMTDLQEVQRALKTETGTRAQSITETIEAETIRYQPEATDRIEAPQTTLNDETHPATQRRWKRLLVAGAAVVLLLGATFAVPWLNRALRKAPPTPVVAAVEQKDYREMTKAEQEAFIGQKSQEISTLLGERPTPLNAEAVKAVMYWVAVYNRRRTL